MENLSTGHILYIMKHIAKLAILAGMFFTLQAQAQDTCIVALRIDNKDVPFEVKNGKDGNPGGFFTKSLNGDLYLYTNKPIIKIVNESSSEMRNKNTGEYRVITFDNGSAQTYDYTKAEGGKYEFAPKNVNNLQNTIYFSGDIAENTFSFMLENNANYRRTFRTRSVGGEFDGLKNVCITIADANGNDSTYTFSDSEKLDSLLITPGSKIKRIAATRGRNGMLTGITVNDNKLNANYTFRNKQGIFDEDNYSARNATICTSDSVLNIETPCTVSIDFSYLEGDNNVQTDHRQVYIEENLQEESSMAWLWALIILLIIAGIGYYYWHRYQLKKAGIIPETDAEKVKRLEKEVSQHTATISGLKQTEASLLSEKAGLQKEVAELNDTLATSRQETKDKAAESDNYRDALSNLKKHTDDVQHQLNKANDRIKVYEDGTEHIENMALKQQLADLNQEMDEQKKADAQRLHDTIIKKDEERALAVAQKQQEMQDLQGKNENELNQILAKKQQELVDLKLQLDKEKADAVAKLESDSTSAFDKMRRDLNGKIALLTQTIADNKERAEKLLAETKANALATVAQAKEEADKKVSDNKAITDALVAETKNAASKEIATTKENAAKQIAEIKASAEKQVAETKATADKNVAEIRANANTVVTETRTSSAAEISKLKENNENAMQQATMLLAATKSEYEQRIAAADNEHKEKLAATNSACEEKIAALTTQCNEKVANLNAECEAKVAALTEKCANDIANAKEICAQNVAAEQEKTRQAKTVIASTTGNFIDNLQVSLSKIELQITELQGEVEKSNVDNNYKNVINHMSLKFIAFNKWFQKNIVEGQKDNSWSIDDVKKLMQAEIETALTNNYSWTSEMMRFHSYISINRKFLNEFLHNYIPVDFLKGAFDETNTLFGKVGITLHIPCLFVDEFNREIHKLNNTPLINSCFPQGFIEYKSENRGIIYDMLRPGYDIEGETKQLPEVCVF